MGEKSVAFFKGGIGCLLLFFGVALVAVLIGGGAHIDLGGFILLFVIGGGLGLVALAVFNRGRESGRREAGWDRIRDDLEEWGEDSSGDGEDDDGLGGTGSPPVR